MASNLRIPPNNIDAERSVLGCCMAGAQPLAAVMNILKTDDFYQPNHRTIYDSVISLSMSGKPVDILTVSDHLQSSDDLERIGGMMTLTALQDATPLIANAEYYAKVVRDKAILRRLLLAMDEITLMCYEEADDADRLLDLAAQRVFAIREGRDLAGLEHLQDIMARTVNDIAATMSGEKKPKGLRTGFPSLDYYLGGLKLGSLNIVAARPAMGKSAFALNIAHHAALQYQAKIAIFSLEMSKEEISYRFLSSQSLVDSRMITRGEIGAPEWQKISDGVLQLYGAEIYIDDRAAISPMEILSRGRQMKMERGLDLILIDYLQLMGGSGKSDSRQQEISEISRTLKVMAKELEVPVVALSQLSRAVESRSDKRPMLSDLRESGAIEQDADTVTFLYRKEYYAEEKKQLDMEPAEIIIAKNRSGSTGAVFLDWHPKYTLFTEPDIGGMQEPPPFNTTLPDPPFDFNAPDSGVPQDFGNTDFDFNAPASNDINGLGYDGSSDDPFSDGPFDLN